MGVLGSAPDCFPADNDSPCRTKVAAHTRGSERTAQSTPVTQAARGWRTTGEDKVVSLRSATAL